MKKDHSFDFQGWLDDLPDQQRTIKMAEVGVFYPKDSELAPLLQGTNRTQLMLVEPQPECAEELRKTFFGERVMVHEVAVTDSPGQITLYVPTRVKRNPDAGASAYIEGIHSPHAFRQTLDPSMFTDRTPGRIINKEPPVTESDGIRVEAVTFDTIDPGNLDILHVDVEGAEWFVLKHMISRPLLISLEMFGPGGYVNPYTEDIFDWMRDNGYTEIDRTLSDIIYERRA